MLTLTIEKKWFDMILSGEKTEEYRELKRYYDSRFRNAAMLKNQEYQASVSEFRNLAATVDQDIGTVRFRNGYTTDAPCFLADCKLTVGEGKPEWGAVPGTEYYILKMKNVKSVSFVKEYFSDISVLEKSLHEYKRLSKKVMLYIYEDIVGILLVKVLFLVLAMLGKSNMILAILADVGVLVLAVLNSLRIMLYKSKYKKSK